MKLQRHPAVKVEGKLFEGQPTSAVIRAAKKTQDYAIKTVRAKTPKDTGRLAGSWYSKLNRSGQGVSLELANDVYYAPFLEYGTKKMKAVGMATRSLPVIEQHFKTELQRELSSELGGALESVERATAAALTRFFGYARRK